MHTSLGLYIMSIQPRNMPVEHHSDQFIREREREREEREREREREWQLHTN